MRTITTNVSYVGAIDWNRRIFDALMPIPDGTSYNAYLVHGANKAALIDTVEAKFGVGLLRDIADIERLDYIVIQHTEQDHSGTLPLLLDKYSQAYIVTTSKGQTLLQQWFDLPLGRFIVVKDGDRLDLGDRTLVFYTMPWVHWPDTMVTYLPEERTLFTCDLFGAHLASSDLFAEDNDHTLEATKHYYAVIMQPFRSHIGKYLDRIVALDVGLIAPSHGPVFRDVESILDAYHSWVADPPKNKVVLPFVTMHDSTLAMVEILTEELMQRGVSVQPFDLTAPDINRLAEALVDAATIVIGSPLVLGGAHPNVLYAAHLANYLKPKARFAAVIGSLGWGGKMVEQLVEILSDVKLEFLEPVLCKGIPREKERAALATLAETIAEKHKGIEDYSL